MPVTPSPPQPPAAGPPSPSEAKGICLRSSAKANRREIWHMMQERLSHLKSEFHTQIAMVRRYDPSITSNSQVALTYSGLHAVWCYRIAHRLWLHEHRLAAQIVSQVGRMITGVEIHPGARIGQRLLIDHGTGIVIGETAVLGDDIVLYQGVTLGGVRNHAGKRHPTLGDGVLVGAGAKILGAIVIGSHARIGANAVVLHNVPEGATAVGVPAHVIQGQT